MLLGKALFFFFDYLGPRLWILQNDAVGVCVSCCCQGVRSVLGAYFLLRLVLVATCITVRKQPDRFSALENKTLGFQERLGL